jgi:AraC-like DNA-binding protein
VTFGFVIIASLLRVPMGTTFMLGGGGRRDFSKTARLLSPTLPFAPLYPAASGHPAAGGMVRAVDRDDLVRLRHARDQMDREYANPLDVEALARTACMSSGHFSRSFRAAYGETPYSYLMTRRIERAMTLLRRGDLSVTDVCFEVGCSSLGTFSTRFTELVGESPSAYRARDHSWMEPLPACLMRVVLRPVRNREAATTGSG